jgi:hypothetical protein
LPGSSPSGDPLPIDRLRSLVLLFDAAGLALFAVAGAQKALAFGLNPVMAALLGMLTGIGAPTSDRHALSDVPPFRSTGASRPVKQQNRILLGFYANVAG